MYPLIRSMGKYIKAAGLETTDIDQVIRVAQGVFGLDWLEESAKKRTKDTNPFLQHPIFIGCSSGSFMHLMELIELCTYVLAFKDDKELPKIISGLKQRDSYEDFLFHLAMAYRFKKLGFKVQLEPSVANGKAADFSAYLGDIKIMAECTISREWAIREEDRNAFFECQGKFKKLHNKSGKQVVVDIITKGYLKFDNIQKLKDDIMSAGNDFINSGNSSVIFNEFYEISVSTMEDEMVELLKSHESKKEMFKGWDQMVMFNLGIARIPGDISSVDLTKPTPGSLMRYKSTVSPEDEFSYSLDDIIDNKVSGKFDQLKAHPKDHTSLLFLKVSDKLKKVDSQRVGMRLWNGIFNKVPSVNGVLLTERDWIGSKHQYLGTFFNNRNNPTNEHLFDGFNIIERDIDFVKEWHNLLKG